MKRLWWVGKNVAYIQIKNILCLITTLYHLSDRSLKPKSRWPPWINKRKLNVCSLSNLHSVSLITKVCFHIVPVANAAPVLMEAVAGRLSFRVNTVIAVLEVVCHAFPLPKLNENRSGWLIGTTVVGSCFIYESWWFSPARLLGPVIHEWTRQPEPAIVEVHWEQWILRINSFRVRLLFPTPIKSLSLLLSIYNDFPIS